MYLSPHSARTAKAPYEEKIKLLFNFFKDSTDNGIKYIDFTKMVRITFIQLYNYSRDELKEILMEDKYMIGELYPSLTKSISEHTKSRGEPSEHGSSTV